MIKINKVYAVGLSLITIGAIWCLTARMFGSIPHEFYGVLVSAVGLLILGFYAACREGERQD